MKTHGNNDRPQWWSQTTDEELQHKWSVDKLHGSCPLAAALAQSISSNYILQSVGMSAHDLSPTCWVTVPRRLAAPLRRKCYVKTELPFWGSLLIRKKKKKKKERVQTLQSHVVEIILGLCFSFRTFFNPSGKQKHESLKWPRRSVYCFQGMFLL